MKLSEPIEFSIQLQTDSGRFQGPGTFDGVRLTLGDQSFSVAQIHSIAAENGTFQVTWWDDDEQFLYAEVDVYEISAEELHRRVRASQTEFQAAREKTRLIEAGQAELYNDMVCPFCQATIMLVDIPDTPQVYCKYCETLFSRDRRDIGDVERHFRICKGCGMYSRPRHFSVFYFYFLIFTFGFHHDSTFQCSACMRRSAWKMVIGNLFGLLALPFALMQLRRAYATENLTGIFQGLDDANGLAARKKIDLALDKYDQVMDRVPVNAGVKFNIATGLMLQGDYDHARQMFQMSLEDCANYWPAIMGMVECLEVLGDEQQLAATRTFWNLDPS